MDAALHLMSVFDHHLYECADFHVFTLASCVLSISRKSPVETLIVTFTATRHSEHCIV